MREGRFFGKVAGKARCAMLTLFHYPICPHSRFVRLVLEEYGLTAKLVEERVWERRLLPAEHAARIEVRRLMNWFNDKFFEEASGPLVTERVYKRHVPAAAGGGPPDTETLRAAKSNIKYHLAYIGWLVRRRDWLAGDNLTYADLSAAAHLSVADYLGDVPWDEDETAKSWYARIKSRPSFRGLLAEALPGLAPSKTYADLDF